MRYTLLPGTDIQVSVIAMGSWALAGDMTWGDQSEADSLDAARAALDAGINFFDTAPGYGEGLSERRLGEALRGVRHRAVIATQVPPEALQRDALLASVDRSLVNLRTDYVDLLQIHWPSRDVPIRHMGRARGRGARRQGTSARRLQLWLARFCRAARRR